MDLSLSTKHGGWLKHMDGKLFSNELTTFYQVCGFKNINGKYCIKKIQYYDPNKIISEKKFEVNGLTIKRFLKEFPPEKYKIYSSYDLDDEPFPQLGELLKAQSIIFNNQSKYIKSCNDNHSRII
jgi:hypothetical protein